MSSLLAEFVAKERMALRCRMGKLLLACLCLLVCVCVNVHSVGGGVAVVETEQCQTGKKNSMYRRTAYGECLHLIHVSAVHEFYILFRKKNATT